MVSKVSSIPVYVGQNFTPITSTFGQLWIKTAPTAAPFGHHLDTIWTPRSFLALLPRPKSAPFQRKSTPTGTRTQTVSPLSISPFRPLFAACFSCPANTNPVCTRHPEEPRGTERNLPDVPWTLAAVSRCAPEAFIGMILRSQWQKTMIGRRSLWRTRTQKRRPQPPPVRTL